MATSTEVPGRLPVAIDGHVYLAEPQIRRATVPVIRQQADTSTEAGEQTLNPQGLWRRSQESWHHGAGQTFLDGKQGDEATDPHRYRSSKGIDPWTKGVISLLRPTIKSWSSTNTNLQLAVALDTVSNPSVPAYLFVADGTEVYYALMPYGLLNTFAAQTGTGWTATNATITQSTVGGNPNGYFRLVATASAAVTATSPTGTSGIPVEGGREYGYVFASRNLSGSGAKFPTVQVNWYTSAGTFISSTSVSAPGTSDASLGRAAGTAIAPSNAAYASITVGYTVNLTNGDAKEGIATIGPLAAVSTIGYPDVYYPLNINAGQAAQTVQSLATDGSYVWAALGTSGLHRYQAGGSLVADVPAAPASGQISLVGYANGFLLAAGSAGVSTSRQNSLWLVNDPLGTPSLSLIKTHPNTSFVWTGIAPGRNCVYAYGNSGGNGEVYKILFDPNTGALSTAASFATYLPDGETIHALQFYAGGIIMGTGKGVRLGQADGAGNIDYGPLIPTTWPVRCLEPQDRYCWFGWTKYDTTNSGLGRVDLGYLTDQLTPAWASDLMTSDTTQGDVVSAVTFSPYLYTANQRPPVRVFSVAGSGVYIEDPTSRVASGTLDTGAFRFSTSEPKLARSVDIRHHGLGGFQIYYSADNAAFTSVGATIAVPAFGFTQEINATAESLELRFNLIRPGNSGTDFSRSTDLTRWTLKALPMPTTVDETFEIPLVMRHEVLTDTGDGIPYPVDVTAEIAYLKGLERSRQLITVQIGSETITNCFVLGSEFRPDAWGPGRAWLEGTYVLQISTARG